MTPGTVAARAALCLAAWSAVRLWQVSPRHAPVAQALVAALALDLARLLAREVGAPVDVLRVLYLGAPCCSAWLAGAVLLRRPRAALVVSAAAWLALSALVVAGAWPGREAFAGAAGWVAGASVAVQVGCALGLALRRGVPTVAETCALVLLAGDLAGLAGAWRFPEPWRAWEFNRWQVAVTCAAVWWWQWRRLRWTQDLAVTSAPGSSRWARS